ncbi:hypothetical protein [Azoarcus sp. DN11]|uniref:hypothetical protein n=1 Tax=Azoarcus sp. DN11 TaxID=356837 RepID=UPI000EB3C8DE|nr:hypothetical protein [Azoarcus sp. DN11]AYH43472.1 hypothetical protein CDA09_08760 [Azoarcus sp. DN11]
MARTFTKLLATSLVAGLLGGCIILPLDYDDHGGYGHHHRYWGNRGYGDGYRYWDDDSRSWRYRR